MCHFFTKPPLTTPGDCHWKGGETFLDKPENATCFINFFSNWCSELDQKWQYIGIFHPLRIFWCIKLRVQSISFCTASHLQGTPTRNLHFCGLFVYRYLFPKWYHCTSFMIDLLFVFYLLCFWGFTVTDFQQIYYFHFSELNHVSRPIVNLCKIPPPYNLVINLNLRCLTKFATVNKFTIDNWYLTYY